MIFTIIIRRETFIKSNNAVNKIKFDFVKYFGRKEDLVDQAGESAESACFEITNRPQSILS